MQQLEFFPKRDVRSLADFQSLEAEQLSLEEKRALIQTPGFFQSPKANFVIKQQHSDHLDRILGVRVKYIEEMLIAEAQGFDPDGGHESWGPTLHQGVQTWVGLDNRILQTPYSDCLKILQLLKLKPFQHVIDLGAAYGRMGVVVGGAFIKSSFTGYEYVSARVEEGNRIYEELGLTKSRLVSQDLFDPKFMLPDADIYFIYDYGHVEHIDHTLKQLNAVAQRRPIKVVVRGKFTKKIILDLHPWLELKYEGKSEEAESIYVASNH